MREIAENLNSDSRIQEIIVMKSGQSGGTAMTMENRILESIAENPRPILFVTATEDLARRFSEARIEPMIELAGLNHLIKATTENKSGKVTGNKTLEKTWRDSGRLTLLSYGNISQIRSMSYADIFLDEEDEAVNAKTKQGKFVKVARIRCRAYGDNRKILRISTPLREETSEIYPAFLSGDQRRWFIPCPHCNGMQYLEWHNLKWKSIEETDLVDPVSVHYQCCHCKGEIKEHHKPGMLRGGEWRPTNPKPSDPKKRSYHINALMLPPGMDSWEDLAQEFIKARGDPAELEAFINLSLGEPYKGKTVEIQAESLHSLKRQYYRGQVPSPVLFATMGVDVQKGGASGKPRIEAELLGFAPPPNLTDGSGPILYSIDYYILEGGTATATSGSFAKLRKLLFTKGALPMKPEMTLIDSGWNSGAVKSFCDGTTSVYPAIGEGHVNKEIFRISLQENYSTKDQFRIKTYKDSRGRSITRIVPLYDASGTIAKMEGPLPLYEINKYHLTRQTYNSFDLRPNESDGSLPGWFCGFPIEYDTRHFKQLTADKLIIQPSGRMKFDNENRKNEALACRRFALAAFYAYANKMCQLHGFRETHWPSFWRWAISKDSAALARAAQSVDKKSFAKSKG